MKLYNDVLEEIGATIDHLEFLPNDGIPDMEDDISRELGEMWIKLPEFKYSLVEQLMGTFMPEALNRDGGDLELRKLLDRIGLECIELSDLGEFLWPNTVCYSEEKIILGKGPFVERLEYAKRLTESAYLNGQIGKVRHLCYIILQNWSERVSLNDIYWVFVFYALTKKYGNENYTLNSKYSNALMSKHCEQNKNLIVEGNYQYLIDVLLMLQEPYISDVWIEKYKERLYECEYSVLKNDLATSLLLENIIGMFWYYDDEKIVWKGVADYIAERLTNHELLSALEVYCEQLSIQTNILYRKGESDRTELDRIENFPMARAWKDFWDGNWNVIEKDIPHLCKKAVKDRDYLCSVQGFINIAGNVAWFETGRQDTTPLMDWSIGRSRYNRIIMEQPLPIYWSHREQQIETLLSECIENPLESAGSRTSLIRLISLRKMDALKFWNLGEYMETLRNEVKLYYLSATYIDKFGDYSGREDYLSRTIIGYIKGLDKKILSQEQLKKVSKLLCKYFLDGINEVVDYIVLQSKEIEWQYVLDILDVLSPYLDKCQKKRLIDWILLYNTYYKRQNHYFNIKQYLFLRTWLEDLDESDWIKLEPIIEEIFCAESLYISNRQLAISVLKNAPWDVAMKHLQDMERFSICEMNRKYISEAVLVMSAREDATKLQLHEFIFKCLEEDDCEFYRKTDSLIDIKTLYELNAVDISKVREEIEKIKSKIQGARNLSGYNSQMLNALREQCTNQNWSAPKDEEVIGVIDDILGVMKEYKISMSALCFGDFCLILNEILRVSNKRVREYLNSQVMELFIDNYFLQKTETQKDAPFNNFHFYDGSHNLYEKRVMYLILQGMTSMQTEYIGKCIKWSIRALNLDEPILFQYAVVLFSYFYFMCSENSDSQKALMGLMYVRGRIMGNGEKVEEIKKEVNKALEILEKSENWFAVKKYLECVEDDKLYKEMFYAIKDVLA